MPTTFPHSSNKQRELILANKSFVKRPIQTSLINCQTRTVPEREKKLTDICLQTPRNQDPTFSSEYILAEKTALEQSLAPSTTGNYVIAVQKFIQWARALGFQNHEIQPASEDLIAFYIAQFVGRCSESHAKTNLNAIRQWHLQHGFPWAPSLRIETIICGIKKSKPATSVKANCPPVSLEMMKSLRNGLNLQSSEGACCWAIACAAF
jgi:hypothetical protein